MHDVDRWPSQIRCKKKKLPIVGENSKVYNENLEYVNQEVTMFSIVSKICF